MATELSVSRLSRGVDIDNGPADTARAAPLRTEPASIVEAVQRAMHIAPDVLGVVNPATGELIASVFATAPSRVPAIVARAEAAAGAWGNLPFRQRAEPLARLRELVAQRAREIAETIAGGTGRPLIETLLFEVTPVIDTLDDELQLRCSRSDVTRGIRAGKQRRARAGVLVARVESGCRQIRAN